MIHLALIFSLLLSIPGYAASAATQQGASPAENAALRYWSAFALIQDSAMTAQQAKNLRAVVDSDAPYNDAEFKELLGKNEFALKVMSRGTELPRCTWGLDYALGEDLPVDYAGKALVLGRMNILNIDHLFATGNRDGGVRAIAAGLRFSRDVGNGGSFFAMLVAKSLLVAHLRVLTDAVHAGSITAQQRMWLREAVEQVRGGLDWSSAAKLELHALRTHYTAQPARAAEIDRIIPPYVDVIESSSSPSSLNTAIAKLPPQIAKEVPNPVHISEQKRELDDCISRVWSLLGS